MTFGSAKNVQNLLAEVYELLEGCAPTWYSEELSERLQAALKTLEDAPIQPTLCPQDEDGS